MRHARLLELRCEVPCEHATNESPEGITDNEGSDPSIGLSESDQAADPKTLEHCRGEFRTGKPKGGAVQQLGILLIVEAARVSGVPGARGSAVRARAAAESSPRWTRDVARLARAASLVVSPRRAFGAGAAAAAASCNSAPQLPALKQAQRRSSSSGGSRVSPGARKNSIRGARQNSFHPRASSPSHAGCLASRRPARSAVRRAPRMRGGADCSVRTRCRQVDWRSIASRAARPRRMPASAAALTCWRRVPVGLECACCVASLPRAGLRAR